MILLIAINGITSVYVAHGGGGSCGNCVPPTLGVNAFGIERVEGGITINSIPFDVETIQSKHSYTNTYQRRNIYNYFKNL